MDAWTECLCEALAAEDVVALFDHLSWQTEVVPISGAAWQAWGWSREPLDARLIARSPGCRVLAAHSSPRRDVIVAVARHAPLEPVLWCFVDRGELTLAVARRSRSGWRVRTMAIDTKRPDAMGLERLRMLDRGSFARPELDPAEATALHLDEVLDAEGLTRAFFDGFRNALQLLTDAVTNGPETQRERRDVSLVVLLRLVFVYFLQREGMLAGDRRYIARRLRRARAAGRDDFFEKVLRPLFFGVLNTPPEQRDELAARLGEIPFLNGGLFEPTAVELTRPKMRWNTDVLGQVVELFERFHFTATQPTGEDEARVVDPEMLGKVFEGLMYGDERKRSGSFYTPRDIVRQMVDTAIDAYVVDRAADGVDPDAALSSVRILDPAVGTGAFLLESFASLRRRRIESGLATDYAALRTLVHDHLFGVDRNRTAVRLCELRIWLVMLGAMRDQPREMEPLPNLSHRITAGDSLLDGSDVLRRARNLHPGVLNDVTRIERKLAEVQREFLEAHAERKAECRAELQRLERELQLLWIDGRRRLIERRLEPMVAVEQSADLFGEPVASEEQQAYVDELHDELDTLDQLERAAREDRAGALGFSYETRFGSAAREGFDIVVTNPPWVRAQHVGHEQRAALTTRYETASGRLWAGARELGIRTPYGTQPDLAALFVERSLELLRPGGRLAALVPAKLFRALHASPMRRLLADHRIERVEDLSDAHRQLFDATVYPGILHIRKASPQDSSVDVRVWRGDRCARFRRSRSALTPSGRPGEPWLLVPDDVHAAMDRVRARCRVLGEDPELGPRRGIFTGANDVFVRARGEFEAELGPAVRPYVRPLLTGSGLGEPPRSEVLWCYADGSPLQKLPPVLADYFERHRDRLERRTDYRGGPLWQVFRVRDDTCRPKVAWRDMSVLLDPVVVGEGAVPVNTVYYVPFSDPRAAAGFARWMSSVAVRAFAHTLAEHARGGWRRHFAWVVRMLPIPDVGFDWASFREDDLGLEPGGAAVLRDWLDPERGLAA